MSEIIPAYALHAGDRILVSQSGGPVVTVVRVIETGSFSAAARQLRIGQPAVSKTIAQLEERLGVRLLLRSSHGLTQTEAGWAS